MESEEIVAALDTELSGDVPSSIARYAEIDPELFSAYMTFRSSVLDTGVLPRKDKLLMVVALLVAQKDQEPIRLYSGIARSEGASDDEIREAVRVGVLFSGGAGLAAASVLADLLEEAS